jgi:NADH dehydrogenase
MDTPTVATRAWPVVAITGAAGQVGRALLTRLARQQIVTMAISRQRVHLPARVQVVGELDSAAAQFVMQRADIIVHLAGALRPTGSDSYASANVGTARAVARAARIGNARRIVTLSYVGATPDSTNEYLHTKALAEDELRATGKNVVVFRCGHIIGPPDAPGPTADALMAGPLGVVSVIGGGHQRVMPIYLGDVVTALARALGRAPGGVYDLVGPDEMTIDELAQLVNRHQPVRIAHIPPGAARLLARLMPGLPPSLVDVLLRDCVGDSKRARVELGVDFTRLASVWPARPFSGEAQAPRTFRPTR